MRSSSLRLFRIAGVVARSSQSVATRSPSISREPVINPVKYTQSIRMFSGTIIPPQTQERIALDRASDKHFNEKGGLNDYAKKNGLSAVELMIHVIKENSISALKALFYRGDFREYVNYKSKETNKTPLEYAVTTSGVNLVIIDKLLEYANPDILSINNKPLLVEVIENCAYDKAELLIINGANINIIDPKTNKTPLDYAIESKNPVAIALLNEYGALTSSKFFSKKSDEEIILVPGPKYTVYPTDKPSYPKAISYKDPKKTGQNK